MHVPVETCLAFNVHALGWIVLLSDGLKVLSHHISVFQLLVGVSDLDHGRGRESCVATRGLWLLLRERRLLFFFLLLSLLIILGQSFLGHVLLLLLL